MADAPQATAAPTPVKPGWKTSEFWITLGVLVLHHVLGGVRQSPGALGTAAGFVVDGLAAAGYSVARGLAKKGG